jgi:hypothetical protein
MKIDKYHSENWYKKMIGRKPVNKGKKFTHTKEWEQNRLKAIKENSYKLIGRKMPKSKETIKKAIEEFKKARKNNPEKYNKIAINNLPKDRAGEHNGNWKGGITVQARGIRRSGEYVKWRNNVLERDNYQCVDCGNKEKLHVHHIVSMKSLPKAVTIRANGITLCEKCHRKTDSYAKQNQELILEDIMFMMITIPHDWQDYNTVGNYFTTSNGTHVIFVSDTGNIDFNYLIFLHEMVEQYLCFRKGIKEKTIDKYDMEHIHCDDPGSHDEAPYHEQHQVANDIEAIISTQLKVDWIKYSNTLTKLSKNYRKK